MLTKQGCTGWTVNDAVFWCMFSWHHGTSLKMMLWHYAPKKSNIDRPLCTWSFCYAWFSTQWDNFWLQTQFHIICQIVYSWVQYVRIRVNRVGVTVNIFFFKIWSQNKGCLCNKLFRQKAFKIVKYKMFTV